MQQLRCLKCEETFLLTMPDLVEDVWQTTCPKCGAVHLLKPGFQVVSLADDKQVPRKQQH